MDKTSSRVKNTTINSIVAILSKILIFVLQFICRTVFIKTLSTEYLGVNGLFTNILTMLSFAELGIGSAIIFKLYKPIADNNIEQIKTYMKFYQKAYTYIGLIILILGLMLAPFLHYIVKDIPTIKENITFIYILFLINSTISYFFTYKKSIINGYQKEYITTIINFSCVLLQNIVQIIVLLLTKNFILYLVIQIGATLLDNICASIKANKMFPFIKDKKYNKISKDEEKKIFKDVKALVLYKLGYTISSGTDNIIISSFVGVSQVGLLSNYTTITTAIKGFITSFFNGFTSSVGNLNTSDDKDKKEDVFYQILLLSFYIYGFISIGLALLINPLIELWLGADYLLSFGVCIALILDIYIDGMRFAGGTFRNTMGLFQKGKFVPLISSGVNFVLSLILVKPLGIFGVLIATVISRFFISTWYDPWIIHKLKFKTSFSKYIYTYFYYLIIMVVDFLICNKICELIAMDGLLGFFIKAIVIGLITITIFIITTIKMKEFRGLIEKIRYMIRRKKNG